MAKEFFKDLPDTTTPITAGRLNGLLDGEEPMGDLVVDSIRTKNMLNTDGTMLGYTIDSSGNLIQFNYNAANPTLIKVKPNTKYTFSAKQNIYKLRFNEYNSNKTFIQKNEQEAQTYTITTTANTQYISWSINYNNQDTITQALLESLNLQIEEGSVATEYKPYQNLDKTLDIYSTSEIRIGTWIGGEPIYRKVFRFNNMPSNAFLTIADVSSLNINVVVNMYGSVKLPQGKKHRPLPFVGGGSDDIRIDIDGNNLRLKTYSNWDGYIDNFIVLEYTKNN